MLNRLSAVLLFIFAAFAIKYLNLLLDWLVGILKKLLPGLEIFLVSN